MRASQLDAPLPVRRSAQSTLPGTISVVGSHDPFPNGYDEDDMLAAARLLADAKLDVVAWNGSKAGSIDFALDHALVARI